MSTLDWVLAAAALLAVAAAVCAVLKSRADSRRVLRGINDMLAAAEDGSFTERRFDESLMSSAESRMAHYLAASEVSAKNLAAEKDKIKELIGDISHQTKTPVSNLLLYAQLLGEREMPEESRELVSALGAQAEKLSFLIGSLVKVSRLEAGVFALSPGTGEIQSLLEQTAEQLAPKAAEKGVELSVIPTDALACFDAKWTAEALYNIADNAIKYTPSGGRVELSARPFELFTMIDVSDTGIGIAEDEQPKIFSRFYRSPSVSACEGVGIGLYLARQIVAGEGGYIRVRSAPGKGSTFSVFLPQK